MDREEYLEQTSKRKDRRIIHDLDDFDMPTRSCTDLLITRILSLATHIARSRLDDTLDRLEDRFHTSKTSASQDYRLELSRVRLCFISRLESHRDTIHTVSRIRRSRFLTYEDMSEMSATDTTGDLRPDLVSIECPVDCPRYRIIEARPSASSVKFCRRVKQLLSTLFTTIDAI